MSNLQPIARRSREAFRSGLEFFGHEPMPAAAEAFKPIADLATILGDAPAAVVIQSMVREEGEALFEATAPAGAVLLAGAEYEDAPAERLISALAQAAGHRPVTLLVTGFRDPDVYRRLAARGVRFVFTRAGDYFAKKRVLPHLQRSAEGAVLEALYFLEPGQCLELPIAQA